jgi:hypothetical protein
LRSLLPLARAGPVGAAGDARTGCSRGGGFFLPRRIRVKEQGRSEGRPYSIVLVIPMKDACIRVLERHDLAGRLVE